MKPVSEAVDGVSAGKREAIIEAAMKVLAREGLAGCSVRGIAAAGPVSKSLIHYYFEDVDEIIALAILRMTHDLITWLEEVAGAEMDPLDGFWAAVSAYITSFLRYDTPLFHLEWHAYLLRKGDLSPVGELLDALQGFFRRRLAVAGQPEAAAAADRLVTHLLGVLIRQTVHRRSMRQLRHEIAVVCGIPELRS